MSKTELEKYLNDLDNLIETGWFPKDSVEQCTGYHKELNLKEFIQVGREYLRQYLMIEKGIDEGKIKYRYGKA